MIKIQPFLIALGSMVAKLTLPIHEGLFQMSNGSLISNPEDDVNDPDNTPAQRQLFWWIGGTTFIMALACLLLKLTERKGKGGIVKRIKKLFK